jgi:hypothetical protein
VELVSSAYAVTLQADELLKESWRRWTQIVESFAMRRPSRHRLSSQAYRGLHRGLMQACHSRAGTTFGAKRQFFLGLEEVVRPWLNLEALARTERSILDDLLVRCRQAEQELADPRQIPLPDRRWVGIGSAALGVVAVIALFIWMARQFWLTHRDEIEDWWDGVRYTFRHFSVQPLAVGCVILALLLVYVLWRSTRG